MCESCGCSIASGATASRDRQSVSVMNGILDRNRQGARHNRQHLDEHGVLAVNLMSAPGSGKTALLESSIPQLRQRYRIAVIEGDLATDNDARRIRALGVPAVQITTGNACHLDAEMVHDALHELDLRSIDLLLIENVGNLVCPASFHLGQHLDVALLSLTEGDDKPQKYPTMFRAVDLVLLTKLDLREHVPEFDMQRLESGLHSIGCTAQLLGVSSRSGLGIETWCDWLGARDAMRPFHAAPAVAAGESA